MKGTARKAKTLVKQSLKDSEIRYRRLFEAAQDGILILDTETGMIEDVNPSLINMLGYSHEEFIKKKIWEVGAFKDIEASKEAFEALQKNEYIRYEDLPLKAKDGRLIQVEFVSNVYLVGDEKVIQCDIRDITEHRRIIKALQENEKKYHDLVNQSPDGIFIVGSSGNILTVNKAMCRELEFSEEELLSMNIWDIIPKQYLDQYRERLTKILEGTSLVDEAAEYEVHGKNGKVHYVEVLSAPHYSARKIIGFQGIARDITARKRAEEALRESERRYQMATWATNDVIRECNFRTNTISWNESLQKLFHYPADEIEPTVEWWQDHIHPAERIKVMNSIQTALDQGQDFWSKEYRFRLVDNSYANIFDRGYILYDEQGNPSQMIGAMVDITEQKRLQDESQESKLMIENIINTIPARVFWKDMNLVYLGCNALFARDAGFTNPKEITGKDDSQMGWRDQSELYRNDDRQVIESGRAKLLIEEPQTTPEGNTITILTSKAPLRNLKGDVIGVIGTYMDITESKQAEAARQESERRFRDMQENIDLIAVMLDRDGRVTFCNDYLLNLTGHSRASVLGQDWFELFLPPGSDIKNDFLAGIQQGTVIGAHYENEILTSSGERRLISWNNTILKDAEGYIIGTNSIGEDITERKQAKEGLELFRTLIDQSTDAIEVIDPETGRFLDVNNMACLKLGYSRKELLSLSVLDIDPAIPQSRFPVSKESAKLIPLMFESIHRRKDGLTFPVEISFKYIHLDRSYLVSIVRDITERKRAETEIRQRLIELELLYQSGLAFSQLATPKVIAKKVIDLLDQEMDWHHTAIRLYHPENETLELLAFNLPNLLSPGERGAAQERLKSMQGISQGISGWVFQHSQAVRSNDLKNDPRYFETFPGLQSGLYTPIKINDHTIGVISIESEQVNAFNESDERLVFTLAGQAAIAIENARLFEDAQRSNSELVLAYETTLEGWSLALDLRDKETEGHTQRVTEMAVSLARAFGLSESELVDVRRGGLLHDIGKMGVPDYILLKSGELTEQEWKQMRRHPVYAFDLLSHIAYLHEALDIPHYHHEKWDGSGYPDGLKGEQIPLAARIFAVVDVWDALISNRPYRPAWTKEKAREQISISSGTHFDPRVVDVFLNTLDSYDAQRH